MIGYENEIVRYKVESDEKWREWSRKMPALHFKPEWDVVIIPPFGGALVRFRIDYNGKYVSVYFDAYSKLGYMYDEEDRPIPYWEIYPNSDGSVSRFYMDEIDDMMEEIEEILSNKNFEE